MSLTHIEEFKRDEFKKQYYYELQSFLTQERSSKKIFPKHVDIFKALDLTPIDEIKVVILGQDPYYKEGQANGLAFSVNKDVPIPPSLKNIFKAVKNDLKILTQEDGDLTRWARQGVLLLNTVLTVEEGRPGSHFVKGWEIFTEDLISELSEIQKPIVFMLWGTKARNKRALIPNVNNILILESSHPSPLSAHKGFFNNKHFSKANEFLIKHNRSPIDWS